MMGLAWHSRGALIPNLLTHLHTHTGADRDLGPVCLQLMICEISSLPRKTSSTTVLLGSGSQKAIWARPRLWKGACTAGHGIREFHPAAKVASNTIFLLKRFLPPSSPTSPSDLCLIKGLFPFITHLAFLPQPAGRV